MVVRRSKRHALSLRRAAVLVVLKVLLRLVLLRKDVGRSTVPPLLLPHVGIVSLSVVRGLGVLLFSHGLFDQTTVHIKAGMIIHYA